MTGTAGIVVGVAGRVSTGAGGVVTGAAGGVVTGAAGGVVTGAAGGVVSGGGVDERTGSAAGTSAVTMSLRAGAAPRAVSDAWKRTTSSVTGLDTTNT